MAAQKPTTIPAYIEAAGAAQQPNLRALYTCLKKAAPDAREGIKWGAPTFTGERIYFSFAAFKNHIGFHPTPAAIEHFAGELEGYETGKATIKFPLDKPLPLDLIEKIARYRVWDVKENDARWM